MEVASCYDENTQKYNLEKVKETLENNLKAKVTKLNDLLKVELDGFCYSVNSDGTTSKLLNTEDEITKTEKNNYIDVEGNSATIPAGFTISKIPSEQKISTGLVIYDIPSTDTVDWNEDKNNDKIPDIQTKYNQYVWIPCDIVKLSRRAFTNTNSILVEKSNLIESNYYGEEYEKSIISNVNQKNYNFSIDAYIESCEKYNGFFVGRYEAGKENNKLVIKRDSPIYNNISPEQALTVSLKDSPVYIQSLINSYAWDTMLEYICQNNSYILSTTTDNMYGNINSKIICNSGTYKFNEKYVDVNNNIYDVIGNVREWTTEYSINPRGIYTNRGGYFENNVFTAAGRRPYNNEAIYPSFGFRTILYIK